MLLRALALLAVLVLPSLAGAAEGLFHLCQGRVQLNSTCCCDHSRKAPPPPEEGLSGDHDTCCDELKARHVPTPTSTTPSGHAWTPLPLAMVPPRVLGIPPAEETLPPVWRLSRGVHRSTAPPLYIQHCSYLK